MDINAGPTEETFITSTREAKPISELSESIGIVREQDIRLVSPSHPAELLNRIPGVHINNLGGEGHMTAIRQPITTSGVYLFLEDGIPTRPTGFFNHNGLYEINMPQSNRVEVIKGPGSALYGSDAIGGVINAITPRSPEQLEVKLNTEVGSYEWTRGLLAFGAPITETSAARVDVNLTKNKGFRDEANYDRQSLNARLDNDWDNLTIKTIASLSKINQSGASGLEYDDYKNNTSKNRYHSDIGFREVDALRLSSEFNYSPGKSNDTHLFSFTPFYRKNNMNMMPSWMVTYDPNIREYDFESFGLMTKYRLNFTEDLGEMIIGFDIDSTPSSYEEARINVVEQGGIYTDYQQLDELNYAFDATQQTLSPYIHVEFQPGQRWRLNSGVRYDQFSVDYDNKLSSYPTDFSHRRPDSQTLNYEHFSPKLGAIFTFNNATHMYWSYRHAFRAPTIGALFRPGSSQNSAELEPVKSISYEWGIRGNIGPHFDYDAAIYHMTVSDDIVSIIDNDTRKSVNAGETKHQGIELGLDAALNSSWQLGVSFTYSKQRYDNFSYVFFSRDCFCNQQINFADNDVAKAPKILANTRLAYNPVNFDRLNLELEWVKMGSYYTDQTNTQKYDGHELLNLRANYTLNNKFEIYARVANLNDALYSTYTSNQVNDADLIYRPGSPRSYYVGLRLSF